MDDTAFELWSEQLSKLRSKRQTSVVQAAQEKATAYRLEDFFKSAYISLEEIMETWFGFEEKYFESLPPSETPKVVATSILEMESILDFELDAIKDDLTSVAARTNWQVEDQTQGQSKMKEFAGELRKRFELKLNGFGSVNKKKSIELGPPIQQAQYSGTNKSGSGISLVAMFVVGLLFGGGPSIYFMNISKEAEKKFQVERSKILSDQRGLEDSMTVLHDSFEQLAKGKGKNIPQIEAEIREIKNKALRQRQQVNEEYETSRIRLLKKIPAGNLQDKALARLTLERDASLSLIDTKEKSESANLIKQLTTMNELIR